MAEYAGLHRRVGTRRVASRLTAIPERRSRVVPARCLRRHDRRGRTSRRRYEGIRSMRGLPRARSACRESARKKATPHEPCLPLWITGARCSPRKYFAPAIPSSCGTWRAGRRVPARARSSSFAYPPARTASVALFMYSGSASVTGAAGWRRDPTASGRWRGDAFVPSA